ncbi:unnamed protein product [Diamesa hyperborea]
MAESVVNIHSTNQESSSLNWIQFNVDYFKTKDGILKLLTLFLGIICMSLSSPAFRGASHFFLFVVICSFIATVLWSFVYFLGIRDVLNLPINWLLSELVNVAISTIIYAIAFVVQLSAWFALNSKERNYASNVAAGFFGCFNTVAYAATFYFLYLEFKSTRS